MAESSDQLTGGRLLSEISKIIDDFQRMMTKQYIGAIEELTSRRVIAFLSQAHIEPDITVEMFFIDRPLDGFGAAAA